MFQLSKATDPDAVRAINCRITGVRERWRELEYIELQVHGDVFFGKDVTMVVVADGATRSGRRTSRLDLSNAEQGQLWKEFTQRFSAQVFRMSGSAMVPLG